MTYGEIIIRLAWRYDLTKHYAEAVETAPRNEVILYTNEAYADRGHALAEAREWVRLNRPGVKVYDLAADEAAARERIAREKAARSGPLYDDGRVRCPKCGHTQDANADAVGKQVTWPGLYGDEPGYEETCGGCGRRYEVDIEITVTLVSPAREGGDRG